MSSTTELARQVAGFDKDQIAWMQRLFRTWGLLADLALGDILVLAPTVKDPDVFVVLGNVRASTAPTLYTHDPVGDRHRSEKRPLVKKAFESGKLQQDIVTLGPHFPDGEAEIMAAPLRHEGKTMGVVLRERRQSGRDLLKLEQTYLSLSNRLMQMIAEGSFPYPGKNDPLVGAPRVGDGLLVLDVDRRIIFQSPNAMSSLHRLGIHRNPNRVRFDDLGLDDSFVRTAFAMKTSVVQEVDRRDVTISTRCLPLLKDGEIDGAFILLRDVSELKRRDRLLVSKDATIREIHHRVKNNLQTISSLLRLQARRVQSEEGKFALSESVRRIAAIAIVHETLANDYSEDASGDDAPFEDVARPLIRLIEEGLQDPENPIRFELEGEAGRLPLIRSMPLAVVLTELLQNVVDHAFPEEVHPEGGRVVTVCFENDDDELLVTVSDNGVGPPEDFEFAEASGLGLTLVQTFVTTELNGTITMGPGNGPEGQTGAYTELRFPKSWEDRVTGPVAD